MMQCHLSRYFNSQKYLVTICPVKWGEGGNRDIGEGSLKIAIFAIISFLIDPVSHLISHITHFYCKHLFKYIKSLT